MKAETVRDALVGFFLAMCVANGRRWSLRASDLLRFAGDHPEAPEAEADIYRELACAGESLAEAGPLSPQAAADVAALWDRLLPEPEPEIDPDYTEILSYLSNPATMH